MVQLLVFGLLAICFLASPQNSDWQDLLRATNPAVRLRAIQALSDLNAPQPILDSLDDTDPFVRAAARTALIQIGKPAIELLLSDLRSEDQPKRVRANHVLINLLGR